MFKGSMVALVTPFKDGEVDYKNLDALVDFHIDAKTDVLVPCGTTGESPTLTHAANDEVAEAGAPRGTGRSHPPDGSAECVPAVVRRAKGRLPVMAGTGSNSTAEAIAMTRHAKESGA